MSNEKERAYFKRYKEDVQREGKPFFPYAMFHDTVMSLVVVCVIVGLACVWYFTSGEEAGDAGHPRAALHGGGRPGDDLVRAAAGLVLLLPLLPPADLQVAGVGRPRHGRDPDDRAHPAARPAVHRPPARAAARPPAGRRRRRRSSSSPRWASSPTRARPPRSRSPPRTSSSSASGTGAGPLRGGRAGADALRRVRLHELPHLPRRGLAATSARPTSPRSAPRGRRPRSSPPTSPTRPSSATPSCRVRGPRRGEPPAPRRLPRGVEGRGRRRLAARRRPVNVFLGSPAPRALPMRHGSSRRSRPGRRGRRLHLGRRRAGLRDRALRRHRAAARER